MVTAAYWHHPTLKRKQISLVRLGEYEVTESKTHSCSGDICLEDPQEFNIRPEDAIRHPDFAEVKLGKIRYTINDATLIRLPRTANENVAVRVPST